MRVRPRPVQELPLHVCDFFQTLDIKEGESRLNVGKQVEDSFTLDAVLKQFVDLCVGIFEGILLRCPFMVNRSVCEPPQRRVCIRLGSDMRLYTYRVAKDDTSKLLYR